MSLSRPDLTIATKIMVFRRERAARRHSLEQIECPSEGDCHPIPLERAELSIGRANEADIRIPSERASRQHAFLTRRGNEYVLRDNDSHNGVFLNGVKVHSAVLRDGDVIQVADHAFVYHEG
jgi:predicted component of type VI protein secretion system